jgi:pimeloyl-ACP methyl ester carboxylesterase
MNLYALSGIGADKRAFSQLKLNANIIHLDWITPLKNESIENYAIRLSKNIDTSKPFAIIGVSFGGLVACEISKKLNPELTILLSTVETQSEIPLFYKLIGTSQILKIIPAFLFNPPRFVLNYFFNPINKTLLYKIVDDADLTFVKWALHQLANWKNTTNLKNTLIINGEKDRLLPPTISKSTTTIKNGGHFMIADKATEISEVLNSYLAKL